MQVQPSPHDRVRVIGTLTAPALEQLLEVVGRAEMLLDLSEVREADSDAVRLLAQRAPDRVGLLACPRWLASRLESERRPQPGGTAAGSVA
jgi:hypothetical protein